MYYILDEDKQVVSATMEEYIAFRKDDVDDEKRFIVSQEDVGEDFWVSTVFLGLDHSFGGKTPVVFETMIFGADDYCARYETYEQAVAGHVDIVGRLIDGWDPRDDD